MITDYFPTLPDYRRELDPVIRAAIAKGLDVTPSAVGGDQSVPTPFDSFEPITPRTRIPPVNVTNWDPVEPYPPTGPATEPTPNQLYQQIGEWLRTPPYRPGAGLAAIAPDPAIESLKQAGDTATLDASINFPSPGTPGTEDQFTAAIKSIEEPDDPRRVAQRYYEAMANMPASSGWFVTPEVLQQGLQNLHAWEQLRAQNVINTRNAITEIAKSQIAAGKPSEAEISAQNIDWASSTLERINSLPAEVQALPVMRKAKAQAVAIMSRHGAQTPSVYEATGRKAVQEAEDITKRVNLNLRLPDGRMQPVSLTNAQLVDVIKSSPELSQQWERANSQEPQRFPTLSSWVKWRAETEAATQGDVFTKALLAAAGGGLGSDYAKAMSSGVFSSTAKELFAANMDLKSRVMFGDYTKAAEAVARIVAARRTDVEKTDRLGKQRLWTATQTKVDRPGIPAGSWIVGVLNPDGSISNAEPVPLTLLKNEAGVQ